MVASPRPPPLDTTSRSSGLLDKVGEKGRCIQDDYRANPQLLGLLETERCGSPGRHLEDTGEGQTGRGARQTGESVVTPTRETPTTTHSSPNRHHNPRCLLVHVSPRQSPRSDHPGSGSTASSQVESPRRVRDRLNHMLQSLRRPSSPTSPPLTAPLPSRPDHSSGGRFREVEAQIPRAATIQRRVSGQDRPSRRDSPPGLVLICESLSPRGKRKVQRYLPLLTSSGGRGRRERSHHYHDDDDDHPRPPYTAPLLDLPPQAAEYLSSPRRQHSSTPDPSSRTDRRKATSIQRQESEHGGSSELTHAAGDNTQQHKTQAVDPEDSSHLPLNLPPETAEYLSSARRQHSTTPGIPSTRHRLDPSSANHLPSSREPSLGDTEPKTHDPPRLSETDDRDRDTLLTTRSRSPKDEHTRPSATTRRFSAESSDSHYSESSDTTEGTLESDEEARELLAQADSGPMPVHHAEPLVDEPAPKPSEDEVRRAREVLKPDMHL